MPSTALFLAVATLSSCGTTGSGPAPEGALAVHGRLVEAARGGDATALAAHLSEDLVVSDPSNTVRGRAELIELFASKAVVYRSFEDRIDHTQDLGDLFVVMGDETSVVDSVPEGVALEPGTTLHRRYTNVYRLEEGGWRLLVKQSTTVSVVPPE